MKSIYILLFRIVLSIILSVFISILFLGGIQLNRAGTLSVILLVLAYLFEYTKKRDNKS